MEMQRNFKHEKSWLLFNVGGLIHDKPYSGIAGLKYLIL